jgi:ATP-dependent DNA helicase RecQ
MSEDHRYNEAVDEAIVSASKLPQQLTSLMNMLNKKTFAKNCLKKVGVPPFFSRPIFRRYGFEISISLQLINIHGGG